VCVCVTYMYMRVFFWNDVVRPAFHPSDVWLCDAESEQSDRERFLGANV
jgi:hypothetical protein